MNFKEFLKMNESSDIKYIERRIKKWDAESIFALNDDLWGNSDDPKSVSEWNDVKNDLDKEDLISMALEKMEAMGTDKKTYLEFEKLYK